MTTVYIASKTKHAPKWIELRDQGFPVISTWIDFTDNKGISIVSDWPDLWKRCLEEAAQADVLLLYQEQGDILKGAWIELGVALANNRKVIACSEEEFSIFMAGRIYRAGTLESAIKEALNG